MIRLILAMILLSTPAMAKDVKEIKIMEDLSDSESVKSKVNVWKLDENGEKIERIYPVAKKKQD